MAEELLAEKAGEILTRSKGRDYFDFWYLLSKGIPLTRQSRNQKYDSYFKSWIKK